MNWLSRAPSAPVPSPAPFPEAPLSPADKTPPLAWCLLPPLLFYTLGLYHWQPSRPMIKTSISHNWWWFSHQVVSDSYDPIDCSPPGSVHGIFQLSILEWVAIFFRESSQARDGTRSPFALQADSLLMNHQGSLFPTIQRPLSYCGLYSILFSFFCLSSFSPPPSSLSCNISCSVS